MSLDNKTIGFIGAGNMAGAIVEGLLKKGLVKSSQLHLSSPSLTTVEKWKKLKINATQSNSEVADISDIIILACKPYQLTSALKGLSSQMKNSNSSKLFVSILAGITSNTLFNEIKRSVQSNARVIRVMPNTPLLVSEGCSAIAPHSSATQEDVDVVSKIFGSLGKSEVVQESHMSAITGLAGSGPAYIFMIIEALSDGAVKQGLPRTLATSFAAQTVLGSAKMVLETKRHPGELKDEVCSAGGTTIHGVHALEKSGLRAALMNGVEAATARAAALGRGSGEPHS